MQADPEPGVVFEDFVQARSAGLFRTALLLTGQDRSSAEDLLQICLERAYRNWARITRLGNPERYVRRILVNAANDRWRRLSRTPERPLSAAGSGLAVPDRAGEVADRDILVRALATLPQRQRSVIVLRYFDGLAEAEIAVLLGCSLGTVRSQVSRGLARMRQAMGEGVSEWQGGARQ
jgi:RNA polymerase sigma-70 factor (sigma-E family)